MISASPTGRPPRELLADSLEDRVRDHLGGSRDPSRHRRGAVGKRLLSGESRLETALAAPPCSVHAPTVGHEPSLHPGEARRPAPSQDGPPDPPGAHAHRPTAPDPPPPPPGP